MKCYSYYLRIVVDAWDDSAAQTAADVHGAVADLVFATIIFGEKVSIVADQTANVGQTDDTTMDMAGENDVIPIPGKTV